MIVPSPFFDANASALDDDDFMREVEEKLDACVPATYEHLLVEGRPSTSRRSAALRSG